MNLLKSCVLAASLAAPLMAFAAPVTLQNGTASLSQGSFSPDEVIDGDFGNGGGFNGWATLSQPGIAVWETSTDVGEASGTRFTFNFYQQYRPFQQHLMRHFQISYTQDDRATFADGVDQGGDVDANWVAIDFASAVTRVGVLGGDDTISPLEGPDSLTQQGDLSILASGPIPAASIYVLTANLFVDDITGFRLELFTPPGRILNGNFVLSELTVNAEPVPLPPALFLLGTALLGLVRQARKKR